eukprot:gb/GECG01009273.1/.p1 GENE.gb/GECG01009273.1/~~gb/GECG01009273.1/.p1  ORF type:complete len:416 (+),score=59.48 gb/GECG01009273.1/:1-1248(+)
MTGYVYLDITQAMENLLSVAPTHTEIMQLVEHVTRNITLGLKDHIDGLDHTKEPRDIWRRIRDHIMSDPPTNVYEEEGLACGMAIVKVCMRGDINAQNFTAKQLLNALGYDRYSINQAMLRYRSEVLGADNLRGGSESPNDVREQLNDSTERLERLEQKLNLVERGHAPKSELDSIRDELEGVRGEASSASHEARKAKQIAEKIQNNGMDVGSGSSAQQQMPAQGTSTGGQSTRDEMDSLHSHIEQLSRRLNDVSEVSDSNRADIRVIERTGTVRRSRPSGNRRQQAEASRAIVYPSPPASRMDDFDRFHFPFDMTVQTAKRIIAESLPADLSYKYSRYPSIWGEIFLRKVSIADQLKGKRKGYPETIRGAQVLFFFRSDITLAGIDPDFIRERLQQVAEDEYRARGQASDQGQN